MKPLFALTSFILFSCHSFSNADSVVFYAEDNTPHIYTNSLAKESEFLSRCVNPIKENFEHFSDEATPPLELILGTLNAPATTNQVRNTMLHPDEEWQAISGTNLFGHQGDITPVEIVLCSPKHGIGFYVGDLGDGVESGGSYLIIDIYFSSSLLHTFETPARYGQDSCWLYWGVICDEPFDKISIRTISNQEGIWFDDITVIPEPATLMLLGFGGLLIRKR